MDQRLRTLTRAAEQGDSEARQRLYWEAYAWVASNDRSWPYSFVNLCELLDMVPDAVRQQLLGPMAPAPSDEFAMPEEIVEAA